MNRQQTENLFQMIVFFNTTKKIVFSNFVFNDQSQVIETIYVMSLKMKTLYCRIIWRVIIFLCRSEDMMMRVKQKGFFRLTRKVDIRKKTLT